MQQTETYKLNLIESSDPFLPDALNENTRKIEEVVHEKLGEMDQRVTVLEGFKFASGFYTGTGGAQTIELPFSPVAVLTLWATRGAPILAIKGSTAPERALRPVENGFIVDQWSNDVSVNGMGGIYHYIAFGTLN
jgi:hypothetical protein